MPISKTLFVFFLTALGLFFYFYNLPWGEPYFFHPDERNIASSVSQLRFPEQLNPNFFAYGSLPIYTIFFTGLLANLSPTCQLLWDSCEKSSITFSQAIVISRFYSALFSTLLIPFMFFIGTRINNETTGIIAAFLMTTSVGIIQFAHFGTFEMWLTFFTVLLFWCCLGIAQKRTYFYIPAAAVVTGALIAIKVSSVTLLPLPLLALLMRYLPLHIHKLKPWQILYALSHALKNILLFTIIIIISYFITNPYVQLDQKAFTDSMQYESGVALGTQPVFYTGEFFNSIPVLFQLVHVYPFLLNPLILLLALPSFLTVAYFTKKTNHLPSFFVILFFLVLFLSQAFLFVKWTRYMVPTLPFLYLIIALAFTIVMTKKKNNKQFITISAATIILICSVFALSYFITTFVQPDTRVAAAAFAKKTIPADARILSEVYDLGIVPFNATYPNIELFNFYDLENTDGTNEMLQQSLAKAEYIILPSQRVIKSRLLQEKKFPNGYNFYTKLFNGHLGFDKIYETPCDIYCQITYLGNPSFRYEQTANVFDRPTIYIFKKM